MATNHSIQKLLTMAGKFVVDHKGMWEHEQWESFLGEVSNMGMEVSDECKRNLGNILEASKFFYCAMPAESDGKAPATKAATKPRAKAAKPKA